MKNNLSLGVLLTLTSALSYAFLAAIVKSSAGDIPTPVVVFIQSLVCLILFVPILLHKGSVSAKKIMRSGVIHLQLMRTVFSLGISYFLFSAVHYIPLVNAVLLANASPLIVPFIGLVFMSQKINSKLWVPIMIGFVGIVLVLHPTPDLFHPAALLALGSAVCMGSSMLLVRKASATDDSRTSLFYYFFLGTVISGLVAIPFWQTLSMHALLMLLIVGVLFFAVQMTLTYALLFADASIVSSLYYSNIIFAAIISMVYWKMPLTWMIGVGIVLTLLGGILTIRAQAKSSQQKGMPECCAPCE